MNLHLRKTFTNLFFTLTDFNSGKVFYTVSTGMCTYGNKRRKLSSQTIELMVARLIFFLKLYKIRRVQVVLKNSVKSYLRTLIKEFNYHGFPIKQFVDVKKVAHNGVRGRKLRRK